MTALTQDLADPTVFRCRLEVEPILRERGIHDAVDWIQSHRSEASSLFKTAVIREISSAPFIIPPSFTAYFSYVLPDGRTFHQRIIGRPGGYSISPLIVAENHSAPQTTGQPSSSFTST